MTLPSSFTELDSESTDEQELGRIAVLVGGLLVDVAVPSRVNTSAIVNDVIELANDQLLAGAGLNVKFDNSEGKWVFTRLTGDVIELDRSLAEAGVHDGELLIVAEANTPASSPLSDELEGMAEPQDNRGGWFTEQRWMAAWFVLSIALAAATVLILPKAAGTLRIAGVPVAAAAALITGMCFAATSLVLSFRPGDRRRAAWLSGSGLPLIFGGSLYVLPEVHGAQALPMALALTALVALLQLLGSGRARALYTAVIALAVFGAPAAVAQQFLGWYPRTVGAILATVAVMVVYLAPRATIVLSGVPVPRVPTAGEPLDDIETQGVTAVEGVNAIGKQVIPTEAGMADQVRRAREYLTGLVAAAAILAAIGCCFALDAANGLSWQGIAFGIAVATVLCLRGRSHHDLVQSAVLIGGGLVIAVVVIVKTATFVDSLQIKAAIALVTLTVLLVMCGLVAPQREFSPVMRRRVELLELFAIALVIPLACWIIRVYAFFREMRI
ncbi:type VII secretion integral membrane protein EccD [Mycobacterium sp. 1465703.0]|uniref:type VII secretion integral membrane protein EccD n=1 Tax=Mycobacterium sp. 1465703.0 TaxID=1834078 RepID=UPI00080093DC|nr:type VII secretion integral membrane protein EccD [Mycobacterium sp. 1465703.0]OBI96309.1 type VII secretion integral membrane protein EccD [Mycobacterium sp. 1465703.0]